MVTAQDAKYVPVIRPVAIVDNASWTTIEIDTKGWDYLELVFSFGATDIAMAALQITESDTTGTGHVAFINYASGTDIDGNALVLPTADADNDLYAVQIDLRKRKRFIDVTATAGDGTAGTFLAAFGRLSRGEIAPNTSSEFGCDVVVRA